MCDSASAQIVIFHDTLRHKLFVEFRDYNNAILWTNYSRRHRAHYGWPAAYCHRINFSTKCFFCISRAIKIALAGWQLFAYCTDSDTLTLEPAPCQVHFIATASNAYRHTHTVQKFIWQTIVTTAML